MFAAQTGKSEMLNNTIAYYMSEEPSSILLLLPTEEAAEEYSKRRIAPMIRDNSFLALKLHTKEARDNVLNKYFIGGSLSIVGSNSPTKLASKPIKILIVDEVDRCGVTEEGRAITLAYKRTTTFKEHKIILASTPTLKGSSYIENEFLKTNQMRFYVPCVYCGFFQILEFSQLRYNDRAPYNAKYCCIECDRLWNERDRLKAIAAGEWKETALGISEGSIGFHLNALYTMQLSLDKLVEEYIEAVDEVDKQVFVNTRFCESYEPPKIEVNDKGLYDRREAYDASSVPAGVRFVTCAVDIQGDRIEVEFKGWGDLYENWGLSHVILRDDTNAVEIWGELYKVVSSTVFKRVDGVALEAILCFVDSGYNTEKVYSFCKRKSYFVPTKGVDKLLDNMLYKYKAKPNKLLVIDVNRTKYEVFKMFDVGSPGAYYCHFPKSYTKEYFNQLHSECLQIETKKGKTAYRFIKIRDRNEALDLFVLHYIAARSYYNRLAKSSRNNKRSVSSVRNIDRYVYE